MGKAGRRQQGTGPIVSGGWDLTGSVFTMTLCKSLNLPDPVLSASLTMEPRVLGELDDNIIGED